MTNIFGNPPPIESLIPRLVRAYLAANATVTSFVPASSIRYHDNEEGPGPVRAPYIQVSKGDWGDRRTTANEGDKQDVSVNVKLYLPLDAGPCNPSITIPSAPTATASGTGALTGVYRYGLSAVTDDGESFMSPLSSTVSPSGQKVTVTIPTGSGAVWRRLWRTENGRICPRILAYCIDDGVTSFVDNVPDEGLGEEIGPVEALSTDLASLLTTVLITNGTLKNILTGGGLAQVTDDVTRVDQKADQVSTKRGQRIIPLVATYGAKYDAVTRVSLVERL